MSKIDFQIGQIFQNLYPPEAADWCNENCAYIEYDTESNYYIIKQIPQPTNDELRQLKLAELSNALSITDWMTIRENERKITAPNYSIDMKPFVYRDYLRNFNNQEGEWWRMPILTYEEYIEQELSRNDEPII